MPVTLGGKQPPSGLKMLTRGTGTSIVLQSTAIVEVAAATNGPGTGGFDIALPAAIGDVLEWGFSGLVGGTAVTTTFDIYTIVSAAMVNPFGAGLSASTASGGGVSSWYCDATAATRTLSGSVLYAVVAGDIASGSVTMRPYYAQGAATARTLFSNADNPLKMWAKNHGPVTP